MSAGDVVPEVPPGVTTASSSVNAPLAASTPAPRPTKPYKAIYAGLIAALGTSGVALTDGHLSVLEAIGILTSVVLAVGGTYGITNPPSE